MIYFLQFTALFDLMICGLALADKTQGGRIVAAFYGTMGAIAAGLVLARAGGLDV